MNVETAVRAFVVALMWTATSASPGEAQVTTAPRPQASQTRRWEIDVHGGVPLHQLPSGATTAMPDPGPNLLTSNPTFPSRQTSSWFFGDGAALLNDVNTEFGVPNRITPLDAALQSLGLDRSGNAAVGFRIRRVLTRRLSAELSVDIMTASAHLSNAFVASVEATRASFESAITALLATGPYTNTVVSATSATTAGSGREIATTGAVQWRFGRLGAFVPYATLGGGVISVAGSLPSVALVGSYRTAITAATPFVPIAETDRATIRFTQSAAATAVFGGGLRRDVSDRWGFQIDGRVLLGQSGSRALIDANPSVARGTPSGFIDSITNPSIQFSNDPSTGRLSSLSGAPIQGFAALSGGLQARVLVTVGVFTRF
jgi:hypothetical protein